jgi:hypothetical protein
LIIGTLAICTFYVGVRIYEQVFGWYAGPDSFAPEFTTYWMTILYIEEPVELISFLALIGWMWKTRPRQGHSKRPAARGNAPSLKSGLLASHLWPRDLLGRQLLHRARRHLAYDGDP